MPDDAPFGAGSRALALRAEDGTKLRAGLTEAGARGLVLLFPGRTEPLEKYAPTVAALRARGFGVLGIDWRGQGASERPCADPMLGHLRDFAVYQQDVDALLAAAPAPPKLIFAHSMGGCIALRRLIRTPDLVEAAVLSAPMWGLLDSHRLQALLPLAARLAVALGFAQRYAPGGGPAPYALSGFEGNLLTNDRAQFETLAARARAAPEKELGGASWGWIDAAFREMAALRPQRLGTPALALLGSQEDLVSPRMIRARAARDGVALVEIEGARHEPLLGDPAQLAALWRGVDAFLKARGL